MATWISDAWLNGALLGAIAVLVLALVLMWAGEVDAAFKNRDPFDFDERVTRDEDEK